MVGPDKQKEKQTMSTPAHKIRNGVLQVTIWRNTSDRGIWYSAEPSRSYKKGDDAWKRSETLNADDLLPMAKLLDEAHSWIVQQMANDARLRKLEAADAAA
jgi:hypothetical protein